MEDLSGTKPENSCVTEEMTMNRISYDDDGETAIWNSLDPGNSDTQYRWLDLTDTFLL